MLGDKKLFLLDIDGTICKGNQLIGGTKEFLSDIEKMVENIYLLPITQLAVLMIIFFFFNNLEL